MRALIDIELPIPPGIDKSYGDFGFYKFGVCCFTYNGYDGPIHFVNTQQCCVESEYLNPTGFRMWLRQGVMAMVSVVAPTTRNVPGIKIGGIERNIFTGEGFPIVLPF